MIIDPQNTRIYNKQENTESPSELLMFNFITYVSYKETSETYSQYRLELPAALCLSTPRV
jgi:hypothetical protein